MLCQECKERLYPEDPSKSFGGFRPLCYSCPDFDYQKEVLEKPIEGYVPEEGTIVPKMGTTRIINITQRIHLDKSKKKRDRL